ncbi:C39 family peptidase [Candidatus Sumerlaeota bacterium]|nr:C39 family peptidase [Candidatus Sumerlaeota bacterium]
MKKRKRSFLFILLLVTFLSPIIFPQNDDATSPAKSLDEYIREGKTKTYCLFYEEAKAIYEEALKFYTEDWRLNWHYLFVLEKMEANYEDRGSKIIPYYEKRVKENPESPAAYAGLAYGYLRQGKKMLAGEMADKAWEKDEQSLAALHIKPLILKSEGYQEKQKRDEAIKAYNELFRIYPDFFEGYKEFFDEYKHRSDFKTNPDIDFQAKWERALKCPDFDPILYLLETLDLKEPEDKEQYAEIYEKILREDPSHAAIKYVLAGQYLGLGKKEQGLALLKESVSEAPNFIEASEFLANIYSGLQEYALSNEILKKLIDKKDNSNFNYNLLFTKNLYRSGRIEEAIRFLEDILRNVNYTALFNEEKLLESLKSRKPEDRVKIIPGIPCLIQKWNYCGPASVSMILHYWGLPFDQDQIAEKVYIKGMGTITKTMQNYLQSLGLRALVFKGSDEIWKKILDLDIPILLVIRIYDNAHAVVITGYDDFGREFVIHDPNQPYPESLPYSQTEKKRIFSYWDREVVQCLVIAPEEKINQYDLSFVRTPIGIRAVNFIAHLVMGSAILSGLIPGLLTNGAFAFIILFLSYFTIRKTIFPHYPRNLWRFLLVCFILEIILNIACAIFYSEATPLILMIYHIGMLLFLPNCLYSRAIHIFLQFYVPLSFYIRNYLVMIGLGVMFFIGFRKYSNEAIWSASIVVAVLIIFYPFFIMILCKFLIDNKKYSSFFRYIKRFRWIKGERVKYLIVAFLESMVHLQQGENDKSLRRLYEILAFPYLSKQYRFRVKILILENLLEKIKEHSTEREELFSSVDSIIEEIKRSNPRGWNRFLFLLLLIDFSVIKGNYEEARQFQSEADKIFLSKNIFVFLQKKLEFIRFCIERMRSVKIHYDLNRLALARHFERNDIIEEITKKYRDSQDLDFKRSRFLHDLTRH